jgi:hypothetical protein
MRVCPIDAPVPTLLDSPILKIARGNRTGCGRRAPDFKPGREPGAPSPEPDSERYGMREAAYAVTLIMSSMLSGLTTAAICGLLRVPCLMSQSCRIV